MLPFSVQLSVVVLNTGIRRTESADISIATAGVKDVSEIYIVEMKYAAKHVTVHKSTLTIKIKQHKI